MKFVMKDGSVQNFVGDSAENFTREFVSREIVREIVRKRQSILESIQKQ